jgi:signal transduction histidine kinase
MYKKPLKTFYAPANRAEKIELDQQSRIFYDNKIISHFANSISQMMLVLNKERQIVYANNHFLKLLNIKKSNTLLGFRPGEAVKCIRSNETEGGCGTTEFCRTCGSVNAILESIAGTKSVQECRILTTNNTALDFRITATPFTTDDQQFTIFAIRDISNEKRRKNLERVFFHDILNSAGGIAGLSEVLQETEDHNEIKHMAKIINKAAESMIDEIQWQRQLNQAELGELKLNFDCFDSLDFLNELVHTHAVHKLTNNKKVDIDPQSIKSEVITDKVLLRRILFNMIKNALEASPPHSKVTLTSAPIQNRTRFAVHNQGFIPKDVQLQIFQRSFSTKGEGRGIGTYSMKLLGEKYLKGKVRFESLDKNGTTFYIEI